VKKTEMKECTYQSHLVTCHLRNVLSLE